MNCCRTDLRHIKVAVEVGGSLEQKVPGRQACVCREQITCVRASGLGELLFVGARLRLKRAGLDVP